MPTPGLTLAARPTVVAQLKRNAEEFEYSIGKPGGALTFATISEPLTLNLAIANDASSSGVLGYLFDGLTETSWLTDAVEPSLAESWERSEDGLTWTFNLRRDVRWHDGQPFTAQDVDFTFNRIIYNDDIPASSRPSFHFRFLNEATGQWQEAPMTVTALDEGNEIEFSLVTNSGNSVRAAVGALVHEGMEEIGIKADYRLIEFSDLVSQLIESYDWEAMIIGFTGGTDPYSGISFWHSSEGLHLWYPNQPSPATEWEAEIDELYIMGSQELDHDKRVGYYQRAQEVAAENVPVIYTTLSERLSAVRNAFGNLTPTLYAFWDIRYLYRTDR